MKKDNIHLPLKGWTVISLNTYVAEPITGGEIYNYQIFRSLTYNGALLHCLHLPTVKGKSLVNPLSVLTPWKWLFNLISCNSKSIIVVDGYFAPLIAFPLILLRVFTPVKIIVVNHLVTVHRQINPIKRLFIRFSESLLLRSGQIVFVNSKMTFNLMGMSKIRQKAHFLLPPVTVKSKFVDRSGRKRGFISLLYVGYIIKGKGLHILIKSLALSKDTNWRLHIAGDSTFSPIYFQYCQKLIKDLKLGDRIEFLGHLSSELLEKELTDADIFVLPSRNESYGMVYIEAAAYALSIISTVTGVVGEVLIPGESVYTVPFDDVNALAEAIRKLAEDKALRIKLGENAYKSVDYTYGIEAMYQRANEILLKALLKGRTIKASSD